MPTVVLKPTKGQGLSAIIDERATSIKDRDGNLVDCKIETGAATYMSKLYELTQAAKEVGGYANVSIGAGDNKKIYNLFLTDSGNLLVRPSDVEKGDKSKDQYINLTKVSVNGKDRVFLSNNTKVGDQYVLAEVVKDLINSTNSKGFFEVGAFLNVKDEKKNDMEKKLDKNGKEIYTVKVPSMRDVYEASVEKKSVQQDKKIEHSQPEKKAQDLEMGGM